MARGFGIEVLRGRVGHELDAEVLGFWARTGALSADEARRRLAEVVCVLRGPDGAVAGVCSVAETDLPLIGGRRFWVFRSLLPGDAAGRRIDLVRETFAVLGAEFDGAPDAPVGLCVLFDRAQHAERPEAEWADPPLVYAGHLDDERQVRIAYFEGASIAGGAVGQRSATIALPSEWRIEPFAGQSAVDPDAIVDLWMRERVLSLAEARRRVDEVLLVASDERRRPIGVCSAFLRHNDQLRMDLWYSRVFVASGHRRSDLAAALAVRARDHLGARFASGEDPRAAGMIFEVENASLRAHLHQARWAASGFLFIGETEGGAHVRVVYFPGACAPEPGQGRT